MTGRAIIDGNNLLHATHEHAPIPNVGRETLVRLIERWARRTESDTTVVFDGPKPPEGLARQMASGRVKVRFSAPQTADDLIVAEINSTLHPTKLSIVTSDKAIRREARHRRCDHIDSAGFVRELFRTGTTVQESKEADCPTSEKPGPPSGTETDEWLDTFGYDPDISP